MIAHVAILYGSCAAAVAAALLRRGRGLPPWRLLRSLWPFAAVALLESLMLRASGHMVAEWALPLLAAAFAAAVGTEAVARWSVRLLAAAAVGLWLHGGALMVRGYATRPVPAAAGHLEPAWFTPLVGMKRVVR